MARPTVDRANAVWATVLGALRAEVGGPTYRTWIDPLTFVGISDGAVRLSVPTEFMRGWVEKHYAERILALWAEKDRAIGSLDIVVSDTRGRREIRHRPDRPNGAAAPPRTAGAAPEMPSGRNAHSVLDSRFTFGSFIRGSSNELALAAAREVAARTSADHNPFFLHGRVGMGKTHLLHAIGWSFRRDFPDRRIVYVAAEQFLNQFVSALKSKSMLDFKELYRSADLLMIDDFHFAKSKDGIQEELLHTFKDLHRNRRQVVVAADTAPAQLPGLGERLRSWLNGGLTTGIGPPAASEFRVRVLREKARRLDAVVPDDVIAFLAHRITSSIRDLEGALNRAVFQRQVGRAITVETAQIALQDLLASRDRPPTIDEIQACVSKHFDLQLADMLSPRRARNIVRPRQIAIYLAKTLTSRSLPEIGRKFDRDHTTVIHAVRRIQGLRETDKGVDEDVKLIRAKLEG